MFQWLKTAVSWVVSWPYPPKPAASQTPMPSYTPKDLANASQETIDGVRKKLGLNPTKGTPPQHVNLPPYKTSRVRIHSPKIKNEKKPDNQSKKYRSIDDQWE